MSRCREGGYDDLTEAEDGLQALQKTREASFDLIITDYRMPVMDGLEFCRRLRSDVGNGNQSTPIIISSANVRALDTVALEQELRPIRITGKPLDSVKFSE